MSTNNITTEITTGDTTGTVSRILRHGCTIGALVSSFTPGEATYYSGRVAGRVVACGFDLDEVLLAVAAAAR